MPGVTKPRRWTLAPALALALATPLLAVAPAGSQDAAATARDALAAIAKEEAAATAGRLQVVITDRGGPWKSGEAASETRRRLSTTKGSIARGAFTYGAEGWLKDLSMEPPTGVGGAFRNRTAEVKGVLRRLLEATEGGVPRREGRVSKITTTAPADAILSRRVAKSLEGVQWTAARTEGNFLTLEGKRAAEQHVLVVVREPRAHVISWTMTRLLTSPSGQGYPQTYLVDVRPGATTDTIANLEELYINAPPAAQVMTRVTEVKKEEKLPSVPLTELTVRFPAGSIVRDMRFEVPVEYQQTDEGVNEEDVAQTAQALAKGRAQAGDPAPAFELKDPKGKTYRLADYKEKVLVLIWFSARAKNAEPIADYVRELSTAYPRSKGVEVLPITVEIDEADIARAQEYAKAAKWTMPILLDASGETMRKYGLEAAIPKVAVVDRAGKLVYARPGIDPDKIAAEIDRLMGGGK